MFGRKLLVSVLLMCSCTYGQPPIAIQGARIIDGTGAAPWTGTVVLRGDRIVAAGPAVGVPAGAQVVNATGKTLLPGLFDLHTHMPYSAATGVAPDWPKNLASYLVSGVTTTADFGTYPETFAPMRALVESGRVQAPHLLLAARITTPGGHGGEGGRGDIFSLEVLTPRAARTAVRRVLEYRPDVIKVFTDGWRYGAAPDMTSMDEATLRALVEEAHKNHLKVLTHTVTLEKAKIAARAGVDVLAHGIGNAAADDELIRLLREHGTAYVSTLAVFEPRGRDGPDSSRKTRFATLLHNVGALQKAGISLGVGTDAGVTGTPHGSSTLRELELLVDGGLTPMEAIVAATRNSARAVALDNDRGTIEAGKRADLILVDGTPDRNIADIERITSVFEDGKQIDIASLRAMIASPQMSPLASAPVARDIDDFESLNGLSRLGTRWVNSTDTGNDHSRMVFDRILRKPGNHALAVMAEMSEKDHPFIRLDLPMRPGGVEAADVTRYNGLRFDARGDGDYRVIGVSRSALIRTPAQAPFSATGRWKTVKIPFSEIQNWSGSDLLMLQFELTRPAGTKGWLELDNLRFY